MLYFAKIKNHFLQPSNFLCARIYTIHSERCIKHNPQTALMEAKITEKINKLPEIKYLRDLDICCLPDIFFDDCTTNCKR